MPTTFCVRRTNDESAHTWITGITMPDWEQIFSDTAPEMLEGAIQLGEKLGGTGFRWQITGYFLNWSIPWYIAGLRNALGRDAVRELMPGFLDEMKKQVEKRGIIQPEFPAEEIINIIDDLGNQEMDELAGRGLPDGEESGSESRLETLSEIENHIAETAYNIVSVAFSMGRNQFPEASAGEAATWILAMASSSFLHGLNISFGEERAARLHPAFFSRLRQEIREQYEEFPDYPLSHFLDIAGSIGKKWLRLSVSPDPESPGTS